MTICNVLATMRISENTAVVVDKPRDMFRNGMQVLDGNGNAYEILSVGIELLNDFVAESNKTSLLIEGEFSSDKLYVSIDDSILQKTPFKPLSANDIFEELAESRACYERGEYEDFDDALNEISAKYFPEYKEMLQQITDKLGFDIREYDSDDFGEAHEKDNAPNPFNDADI